MATWSTISTGYENFEETINFGTRAVAISDQGIYESTTYATIQADDQDNLTESPKCYALFSSKLGIIVASDKSLTLFENNCSTVVFSVHFESCIEYIELSQGEDLIFCGLCGGTLTCLQVENNGKIVFTKSFINETLANVSDPCFARIVSKCFQNCLDIYIFLKNGTVFRGYYDNMKQLIECATDKEPGNICEMITFSTIISQPSLKAVVSLIFTYEDEDYFIMSNQSGSKLWSLNGKARSTLMEESLNIKQIQYMPVSKHIICISEDGYLNIICGYSFQVIKRWTGTKVKTFMFLDDPENQIIESKTHMVIITDSEHPEILLMKFPVLEVMFKMPVSQHTYLVERQNDLEDILYIEGFGDNSKIDTLRIKDITQSSPNFRLDRLLQRSKFTEAEQLTQKFNLNVEEVYKVKAKWLMEKFSLNKEPDLALDYFNELLSILEKIEAVEFVSECCLKVMAPDLKMTQHLYDYALERLQQINITKTDELIEVMDKLTETKITLGTFIKVYESTSPQDWLIFSSSNPIMICKKFLLEGKIQKAVIVCNRHQERIQRELPTWMAVELFEKIPVTLQLDHVLIWLKSYLPVLMAAHPHLESKFIIWAKCRTKSLELEKKDNWLDCAFNFIEKVIEILNDLNPYHFLDSNNPLQIFASQLQQLIVLKTDYLISIDLEEFYKSLQNDHTELIILILSKVGENKLSYFILGEFFNQFCIKNKLEKDSILFTYVTKLVKQSSIYWDIERAWESRALSIISFLQNKHYKMKSVESTIGSFSIPWNPQVTALVEETVKLADDLLAQKIYNYMKEVPMKLMMKKYGLPDSERCDRTRLIQYILKKGQESMIADAKEGIKFTDANEKLLPYTLLLINTVKSGKTEMGLNIIQDELNKEEMNLVIQDGMSQLITLIHYNSNLKITEECYNGISRLYSKLLILEPKEAFKYEKEIHYVNSIRILKNKYKMHLTLNHLYAAKHESEDLLRKYIAKICYANEANPDKMIKDAGELAYLFNFSREFGLLELCFLYLPNTHQSKHAHFLRLLLESDNSFFKSYSARILGLVGLLIQIVKKGLKSENDFWKIIVDVIRKVLLHGRKSDTKLGNVLLNLAKLYEPQIYTPFSKWHYIGQVETSPVLPQAYFQLMYKVHPRLNEVLVESTCNEVLKYITNDSSTYENRDMLELLQEIKESLNLMPHTLSSIHRIQTIVWDLSTKGVSLGDDNLIQILSKKVFNVLPRIVFSRNLEMELAISLLRLVPCDSAFSWIQNYIRARKENWDQLNNASSVALVGIHYAKLTDQWNNMSIQVTHDLTSDYLKFQCFRKLQRFGIAPTVANSYCETYEGKRDLLLKIITLQDVDVIFIRDVCKDLNFNYQECLLMHLKQTLLDWEVSYEESVNPVTGKSELVLLSNTGDLMLKCSKIEAMITQKDAISCCLKDIINQVNFYYYEVFMVIFDIILKLEPSYGDLCHQHQRLLSFLFPYRRISMLSSDETDIWFHTFPDMPSVPRISKYRLPFCPLPADIWKIIRPELTLGTYKFWLNAPGWIDVSFDKDIICSFTIMNLKREVSGVSEWNLHLEHRALMDDIAECIAMIRNIETAVAALYCVINYVLPPGADRVDAAQKCLLKAREWVESVSQEQPRSRMSLEHAKIGLDKAEKKYFTVSTYHNLYKYQLAKPEYLALSHQPGNLITALYHDPSILNKERQFSTPQPDINEAVTKIANLYDIDLKSLFIQFLSDWIQPQDSLNSSYEEVNIPLTLSVFSLTDNIIRARYLLCGFKYMSELKDFVLSIAFNQDKSAGTRLKALQCLCASYSEEELMTLTARSLASIEELMKSLELISELVKLSLIYTLSDFESCKKEDLLEMLLKHPTPETILVAAKIALTYGLWSPNIWNQLLSSMTSHSMVKILKHTLPRVRFLANKIKINIVKEAWECLIFTTLSQLRTSNENEKKAEDKELEESLLLVESCPVKIDFSKVVAIYNELNYSQAAKIISMYV